MPEKSDNIYFDVYDHSCDNNTCRLLNPCLEELLPYEDVLHRVNTVEESFFESIKDIKNIKLQLSPGPFMLLDWSDKHFIFQLPNKEFIHSLAEKIRDIKPKTIVEVGAGRGIISRHLSNILQKEIIMTDSYEWWDYRNIKTKLLCPNVIKKNYIEAIKEFKPDLIIASWIPYRKCWTEYFRQFPFVRGYIVIGEHRGGATGCERDWITDWKIEKLIDIEKYGICKTDIGFVGGHSYLSVKHTDVTYFKRP